MSKAREDGRHVLIYPEGHLAPPGYGFRFKPGVWHMAQAMQVPVIPVATNLGVFWRQQEMKKTPGTATIEFLPAIPYDLPKDAFMGQLSAAVEKHSSALIAEARNAPITPTIRIPDPPKGMEAQPTVNDLAAYGKP